MGECCAGLPRERLGGPLQGGTRIELVCHVDVLIELVCHVDILIELVCHVDVWGVPYNAPL